MNPSGIRRVLLIIFIILGIIFFRLWKISMPPPAEAPVKSLRYKVRAYALSKQEAEKIKLIGSQEGYKGSVVKGTRTIKKFMGYEVTQDLSPTNDPEKIKYIGEYLRDKGYKSFFSEDKSKNVLRIKIGDSYADEGTAKKVASEVKDITGISFEVKKSFRNNTFKAFIVIFQEIKEKNKAIILKEKISSVNTDVEIISY